MMMMTMTEERHWRRGNGRDETSKFWVSPPGRGGGGGEREKGEKGDIVSSSDGRGWVSSGIE